jgi:hypothetical protein
MVLIGGRMTFETIILMAAKKAAVSGALLLAICTHESGLKNITVPHDGGSPSYGICQIKFETAKMVGFTGQEKDLMKPEVNAKWAAEYLKFQKERYGGEWLKAVAAYNSGTYNPSSKVPGCPRNLQYVKNVQRKLAEDLQQKLQCGTKKIVLPQISICVWEKQWTECESPPRKKTNESHHGDGPRAKSAVP